MNPIRAKRKILTALPAVLLFLCVMVAILIVNQEIRQDSLDRALIGAVKNLDARKAEALLREGAHSDAKDTGEPPLTFYRIVRRLIGRLQRTDVSKKSASNKVALLELFDADLSRQKDVEAADAIAAALVEHGADIHVRGGRGQSVLDDASIYGMHRTVRLLLACNVNVNDRDEVGMTPLMEADSESTRLLLQHGADVNARDSNGNTALIRAFYPDNQTERLEIITTLLEYGADVNATDNSGWSPLYYAIRPVTLASDGRIVRLLERHGARLSKKDRAALASDRAKPQ